MTGAEARLFGGGEGEFVDGKGGFGRGGVGAEGDGGGAFLGDLDLAEFLGFEFVFLGGGVGGFEGERGGGVTDRELQGGIVGRGIVDGDIIGAGGEFGVPAGRGVAGPVGEAGGRVAEIRNVIEFGAGGVGVLRGEGEF